MQSGLLRDFNSSRNVYRSRRSHADAKRTVRPRVENLQRVRCQAMDGRSWVYSAGARKPAYNQCLSDRTRKKDGKHVMCRVEGARMTKRLDFVKEFVENLKKQNLYTSLPVFSSEASNRVMHKGKRVIMLASNNYLGFANH